MTRPVIVVPTYPRLRQGKIPGWGMAAYAVPALYVDAIRRAGGIEAIVISESVEDLAEEILDHADGLLLLGGGDVDPSTYGREREAKIVGANTPRDTAELVLTRAALDRRMPILAVCRGHQLLNVLCGAALDQHISDTPGVEGHGIPFVEDGAQLNAVAIDTDTRVARAMGVEWAQCSCHHHQAVAAPGEGLAVTARSADGVIEATELADPDAPWVVGVQWHPEDTAATDPAQQGLFDTLVAEASSFLRQ
jgi:putative glutamine amidotransferase